MTEHDTPSATPAEDNGWGCTFHRHFASNAIHRDNLDCPATDSDRPVYGFDPDALDAHDAAVRETVLAQVREGLIMEVGPIFGDSNGVTVKRADALAVVDRLEGKP